ncbi:P1 family peptidase [Marinithermus hydrothermalis]|uniref:Peptidase S58 DmpA n=1 Tax=Marinithermus hydrothermalis (strain DSM 14884 / JCM 11576 / T1) TaxID=869210 RepID=F2NN17_MARHT|nr:P1 family peptidase [Marinithermus hydrothermalis]AEB12756.1 peptidase S58 DmpA [Marinithermus hydrothermalis DSM 14884]
MNRTLTGIRGLRVGHWTDPVGRTGCTVILCPPEGCVASAAFVGPSPGTREAALLAPEKRVARIHALLLTGGSAFGLAAADGVVRFLEEQGVGHPTPAGPVPIVPAAVIYDLMLGDPKARPDAEAGYQAAARATDAPVAEGAVGAGAGASAGKYIAPVPTGLGSALVEHRGVRVGALAVVNPVGDVYSPDGRLLAGHGRREAFLEAALGFGHTTLLAVGVEAPIAKAEARQLADAAQGVLGRVIRPSHTPWDGDAAFVLATGRGPQAPLPLLAALVQEAVVEAVVRAATVGR